MAAPKIAKQIGSNGNLASPICHDLAQRMRILSSRVLPNFHVGSRLIRMRAVVRVYDAAGNVIKTHEYKGEFNEP
jgi:hypothetical protein